MATHFLLSAKARILSLVQVARMSDERAMATFRALRWHETGGDPVCPACGCCACYEFRTRRLFKCKGCGKQFSVTSGTTFHGRKLPMRDYLMAIAIFANAAKGISALQLGRDLDVSYKTAFVPAHKLREAMAADQAKYQPKGDVEIDGAYFGGHRKPANHKANRVDRRLAEHQTGKRRVVVVMRERQGRTLPFVVRSEDAGVPVIARRVAHGSTVYADEAACWDELHARFAVKRINHSVAFSDDGARIVHAAMVGGSDARRQSSIKTSPAASSLAVRSIPTAALQSLSASLPISVILRGRPTGQLDASWIPPPRTSQSYPDHTSTPERYPPVRSDRQGS